MARARTAFATTSPLLRRAGWFAPLAASLLLHVMALGWVDQRLVFPSAKEREPAVLTATLIAPPPPPPPAPPPKPEPKPKAKPRPKPAPRPSPKPAAKPVAEAAAAVKTPASVEAATPPGPAADAVAAAVPDDTPPLAELMPELDFEPPAPRLLWQAVDLPPSAELHYDVFAVRDEQKWYGNGIFRWESNGERYRLTGEANATLFFFNLTALNFASEGVINEYGVAPLRYSEKPRNKPETVTIFAHDRQRIEFSAGNGNHPYHGGEQDRGSVIWQLAGIGRAAPERVQPGVELDVVVAGPRRAEVWYIRVLGREQLDTGDGTLAAWHFSRMRQREAGERRIDIWLAPERDWYPVKIRQTDADGDYLELTLDELRPLAPTQPQPMEQQ